MKPSPIVEKSLNLIGGPGNKNALDLGAGCGKNTIFLAKKGFFVESIDISEEYLNTLSMIAKKEGIGDKITVRKMNLSSFSTNKKYNLVIITNVLHLLQPHTQETTLNSCPNFLKKNGILVISHIFDKSNLTPEQIEKKLAKLNLVTKQIKTIKDNPHPNMPYPHKHQIAYYIFRK